MFARIRFVIALATVVSCVTPLRSATPTTSSATTVPSAPDAAAAARARKLVDEVYADPIRSARTPEQKLALAKRVIQDAAETKDDPAGKYVMLGLARDLALDACDAPTAMAAISAMGEFRADVVRAKAEALVALSKCPNPEFELKTLIIPINDSVGDAVQADNYKVATQLADLGVSVAERARDPEALKAAKARVQEVKDISAAFALSAKAAETLRATPADPNANLLQGRFLGFVKGDWRAGLPLLSRGSDPDLKSLSEAELTHPTDAAKQVALGDGWWDVAGHETGIMRAKLLAHAATWYSAALPNETGFAKLKIERRLSGLSGLATTASGGAEHPSESGGPAAASQAGPLVSKFLYLAADDFVVEIYVNGKRVEDEKRQLRVEVYGATAERVDVELHAGDWVVFNVVNDRLRWGGAKYFAAAGMIDEGKPVFWTDASSGKWSFCDAPGSADEFITKPAYLASHEVEAIGDQKWGGGDEMMQNAVKDWRGEAVWASSSARSIWVKYVVGKASAKPAPEPDAQPPGAKPSAPASRPTHIFDVP